MNKRDKEIKEIQEQYHWVYPLILGGVLVIIGIIIGASLFGGDDTILNGNMLAYGTNLWTEAISIAITVFILDQINRRRDSLAAEVKERDREAKDKDERMKRLFVELKSQVNEVALTALAHIKEDGIELKKADLKFCNLENAVFGALNLEGVDLYMAKLNKAVFSEVLYLPGMGAVPTAIANLKKADMRYAELEGARLWFAELQKANLDMANLRQVELLAANLEGASLRGTNLRGAILAQANLTGAVLDEAEFDESTVLPDTENIDFDADSKLVGDKFWKIGIDMTRYTDPNHPDFWEPEWVREQHN